jgi:uncharacterized membrane protein HdeD (DUF308 family)
MGASINMMGKSHLRSSLEKIPRLKFAWLLLFGLSLILTGWLAIIYPTAMIERYLGLIFIVGGCSRLVSAVSARNRRITGLGLLGSAAYLVSAYAVGTNSLEGSRPLGELLVIFLLVIAVIDLLLAFVDEFMIKPGWLFNGLLSLTLAMLILREWPSNEKWSMGVLLGFWLVLDGWAVVRQSSTDYAIEKGADELVRGGAM